MCDITLCMSTLREVRNFASQKFRLTSVLQQIANSCQMSCCTIKFCYTWVNKCNVTKLRHKY